MACGLAGGLLGNRTAWPLLASALLCIGLDQAGVEFIFIYWMLIDLVVALLIIRAKMTYADCIILALFIPAWASYFAPDPYRYYVSAGAVIFQLLLTFPVANAWKRTKRIRPVPDSRDNFNPRAIHAGAY